MDLQQWMGAVRIRVQTADKTSQLSTSNPNDTKCLNAKFAYKLPGVVWIIVMFYLLFGFSFWRHPFTAEDPLVSKWCNAKFLQIYSEDEASSSASWMSVIKFSAKQFFLEESDMTHNQVWWPIIRNCALHLTHPISTHTANTHPKQWAAIYAGCSWGFGALLKAQSWYWRWRERCTFTPPTYNTCQPEFQTRNLSITSPTL